MEGRGSEDVGLVGVGVRRDQHLHDARVALDAGKMQRSAVVLAWTGKGTGLNVV